jgi:hypothetical protein
MSAHLPLRPGALLGLCTAILLALAPSGWAARELPTDPAHRGIVPFGPYQIFPENRPGNGVYLNNRLVLSVPEHTITGVKPLVKEGRFAYVVRSRFGGTELGVYLPTAEPPPRIKPIAEGFYHAVVVIDGTVYKKLFRLVRDTIVDLLPNSKTADGMTVGAPGILFYHVSSVATEEQDGRLVNQFGLRLHLALFEEERLRHLDYPIMNTLPRLELAWNGDTGIEVRLADGRVEVLSISQFQ